MRNTLRLFLQLGLQLITYPWYRFICGDCFFDALSFVTGLDSVRIRRAAIELLIYELSLGLPTAIRAILGITSNEVNADFDIGSNVPKVWLERMSLSAAQGGTWADSTIEEYAAKVCKVKVAVHSIHNGVVTQNLLNREAGDAHDLYYSGRSESGHFEPLRRLPCTSRDATPRLGAEAQDLHLAVPMPVTLLPSPIVLYAAIDTLVNEAHLPEGSDRYNFVWGLLTDVVFPQTKNSGPMLEALREKLELCMTARVDAMHALPRGTRRERRRFRLNALGLPMQDEPRAHGGPIVDLVSSSGSEDSDQDSRHAAAAPAPLLPTAAARRLPKAVVAAARPALTQSTALPTLVEQKNKPKREHAKAETSEKIAAAVPVIDWAAVPLIVLQAQEAIVRATAPKRNIRFDTDVARLIMARMSGPTSTYEHADVLLVMNRLNPARPAPAKESPTRDWGSMEEVELGALCRSARASHAWAKVRSAILLATVVMSQLTGVPSELLCPTDVKLLRSRIVLFSLHTTAKKGQAAESTDGDKADEETAQQQQQSMAPSDSEAAETSDDDAQEHSPGEDSRLPPEAICMTMTLHQCMSLILDDTEAYGWTARLKARTPHQLLHSYCRRKDLSHEDRYLINIMQSSDAICASCKCLKEPRFLMKLTADALAGLDGDTRAHCEQPTLANVHVVTSDWDPMMFCSNCKTALESGMAPKRGPLAGFSWPPVIASVHELSYLEQLLIALRTVFLIIHTRHGDMHFKEKGSFTCIPNTDCSLTRELPILPSANNTIPLRLKRHLDKDWVFLQEHIRPGQLIAALADLKQMPLYMRTCARDGSTDWSERRQQYLTQQKTQTEQEARPPEAPTAATHPCSPSGSEGSSDEADDEATRADKDAADSMADKERTAYETAEERYRTQDSCVHSYADPMLQQEGWFTVAPPDGSDPVSVFKDPNCEEQAFPCVFYGHPRPECMTPSEIRRVGR